MGEVSHIEATVLIPTCGRADKIRQCVRLLGQQTVDASRFEVLVGVDGPDVGIEPMLREFWVGPRSHLSVRTFSQRGQAGVRNALLEEARGESLIFLNDDMRPEPMLVEAHLSAQRELSSVGRPTIVVGDSPWIVHEFDRLFDLLVRETSMIFFYDRMRAAQDARQRDWGFRHAWMLNLSIPTWAVRQVGGLTEFPSTYGFEDDELAWRLRERFGSQVRYRPDAVAWHDHRYEPSGYLQREYRLGYAALGFAQAAPECARELFGRDLLDEAEAAYTRQFVERERAGAQRALGPFGQLAHMPAGFANGPFAQELIDVCYSQHLPLKRWFWRSGLLDALAGAEQRERGPQLMQAA